VNEVQFFQRVLGAIIVEAAGTGQGKKWIELIDPFQ
jgi:hypothetical protein